MQAFNIDRVSAISVKASAWPWKAWLRDRVFSSAGVGSLIKYVSIYVIAFETKFKEIMLTEKNAFSNFVLSALLGASPLLGTAAYKYHKTHPTSISQSAQNASEKAQGNLPRGLRNNNPGNIEKSKETWVGAVGNDGRFLKFQTPEYGVRAMARIIKNYQKNYGIDTVEKLIHRWAPPSDNNPTDKYVNYVSKLSGFAKDQKLDLTHETTLLKIMDAMIKFENGRGLDARTVMKGIRLS